MSGIPDNNDTTSGPMSNGGPDSGSAGSVALAREMAPRVSVVIVNHDTVEYLRRCIRSALDDCVRLDAEVIVVDNHSSDGSAAMVAKEFPEAHLIANSVNVGFAVGVNQGIAVARGELYLVLNADTVIRPGAVGRLVEFMDDHPQCAIAGPRLEYPDGRLQASCRRFYTFETLLLRRTLLGRLWPDHPALREHLMMDWNHESSREVDWLLGAAMIVRRRAEKQVGGMDERYFLYLEDVDWCFRMRQGGWSVMFCPDAHVVHVYRQASREPGIFNPDFWIHLESAVRYYDKWGRLLYLAKHYQQPLRLPVLVVLEALLLGWALWAWTDPPWSALPAALTMGATALLGGYSLRGAEGPVELALLALRGVCTGLLSSGLFFYLVRPPIPHIFRSRAAFLEALATGTMVVAAARWVIGSTRRWLRAHRLMQRRAVIVGTGELARSVADDLTLEPRQGHEVAGFVGAQPLAMPLLGRIEELPGLAREIRAQLVVFAEEDQPLETLIAHIVACRRDGLDVKVVLSSTEAFVLPLGASELGDHATIDLQGLPLDDLSRLLKRAFDVTVSAAGLLLLAPILLAIALALRLRGAGPILLATEHIGVDARPFRLLRFRARAPGPSESGVPAADPFEAFLCRHQLEKLPELVNVLVGDMSLVGPRPPLRDEVSSYQGWHQTRFAEKPGITGLWQVEKARRWRFEQMVRLDLHYVMNRSFLLDLKILFSSVARVLSP